MKMPKTKWKKALLIISIVIVTLVGAGYILLKYLESEIKAKIAGCKIENTNFKTVIDFEYVNNWIVVKAKVGDSDKEYPFIFDTGAQTVIMDSLMNEIGESNYEKLSFTNTKEAEHAFNNEIITLNSLSLGDVKFKEIGTISAKNSKWGMLNCISAYGIIGYNIIQTCGFQIDYEKQQIIITDKVEELPNYSTIDWVNYEPSKHQESPVIPAKMNDSIDLKLFFDTGLRGGIVLSSEKLYQSILNDKVTESEVYTSIPTILIRGEKVEEKKSVSFKASNFSVGSNTSENIKISVSNIPEREFTGFVGNKYFEDYIITLDYKNRRLGFLSNEKKNNRETPTFGFTYVANDKKLEVSSVIESSEAEEMGVKPGDEIYSINGTVISSLDSDIFCEIYRGEYHLINEQDTLLAIEIERNDTILSYNFKEHVIF